MALVSQPASGRELARRARPGFPTRQTGRARSEPSQPLLRLQSLAGNNAVVGLLAAAGRTGGQRQGARVQRDDLKDALGKVAATHTGGDMAWLEQILTAPGPSAETFQQDSPESILESLESRGCSDQTVDTIKKMTFEQLLKTLLRYGVITQSCGQTAALVHGIVAPSSMSTAPVEKSVDGLVEVINTASAAADKDKMPWYVRVEGGGHAFVIEVSGGQCRIYQSFIGTSTLASDLAEDRSYSVSAFCSQLSVALTPSKKGEVAPKEVTKARRGLFGSQAVHPDGKFQVQSFAQEQGMGDRLTAKFESGAKAWVTELPKPAMSVLKGTPPAPRSATSQPTIQKSSLVEVPITAIYDENFEPVASSALKAGQDYSLHWEGSALAGRYIEPKGNLFQFMIV